MIPRLQIRPATQQPSGIENVFPANANVKIPPVNSSTSDSDIASSRSDYSNKFLLTSSCLSPEKDERKSLPLSSSTDNISLEKGTSLSKIMSSVENTPLSPLQSSPLQVLASSEPAISPVPNNYGKHYRHLLLNYSSSTSVSFDTDTSSSSCNSYCSDFSLTPPGSHPPLLVSAKRYGSEVRRQHSKRRRRRRRPQSSLSSDSQKHFSGSTRAGMDPGKDRDGDTLCLWKDEEDLYRPINNRADYSDGARGKSLPLLASSDEEEERTDRIEEIVRAEHLQQARIAQERDKLPPKISANLDPPRKGCLSNPRPKRRRNQATRYKTPPTSPEELGVSSQAKEQQPRRVQFGVPSAVEYEVDRPPGHLTPISQEVTRKRYSMDPKEFTHKEEQMTQETKENNVILSQWEDQFSIGKANSDRTSAKDAPSSIQNRRNRRSSSMFCPGSRMSLDYDHTNESNSHSLEDNLDIKNSSCSHVARSTTSPSMIVAKNLASLSMSPPNTAPEEREHANISSGTNTTPLPSNAEQQTWDFVADLGSINSKGARELSPQLRSGTNVSSSSSSSSNACIATNTLPITKKNTQPPTNINLDTIHSFGAAAFDDDKNCYSSSCENSLSDCVGVSHIECPGNILRTLIEKPSLDQEFGFPSVVRNLALIRRDCVGFERCVTAIVPCFDKTLSCMNELIEQVKVMTLNPFCERSITTAKRIVMTEWKEIEITYIEKLTNILEKEKVEILEAASNCSLPLKKRTYSHSQNKQLIEEEIVKLENEILKEKRTLDLLEASIAPRACILCQATVHLCIHGFSLEEFRDDNILKLNFAHAVYGVQTRVIFDNNSQPGIVIEPNYNALKRDNSPIFELHRGYLNMLVCGKIPAQVNSTELQESLLTIGQFLGRLDQSAMELEKRKASNKDLNLSDEETKKKIKHFVLRQASFCP